MTSAQQTACRSYFSAAPMRRREYLRAGALSVLGLDLPQWLHMREVVRAESTSSGRQRPRAKSCIFLFMWGGPAHQDTWDLKPNAPSEYRGEFQPIDTNVSGLQICEHLPMLAQRADKLAVIRSMTHGDVDHTSATHFPLTGRATPRRGAPLAEDWPSIGAVVSRFGRGRGPLPPFISMMPVVPNGAPRFVEESHGQGAGWLGPTFNPMRIDADASKPDYKVGDFSLHADVPEARSNRRRELLNDIDQQLKKFEGDARVVATRGHYDRAFSLLSSRGAVEAFDLSREPIEVRERYGMNIHGQSVLQARRLVEAGVPFVTVFWPNDGITNVSVYWDTHNRNFIDLKTRLCPVTDQAFSALLDDLQQRGMLDETLIVWTGEMGRTPRVGQGVVGGAGAGSDGRDHWPSCFTSVLAGGGIRGGVVHGSSDRFAAYPASNPTSPQDLAATIYHSLGIDPHLQLPDNLNRPLTICEGAAIHSILS
ncbi:MAG: DUF1501 domain-containing protein [Planctomycetia bacterium]|nr:DUF1501 domain-containing protein [Planctomycetia bacterium]